MTEGDGEPAVYFLSDYGSTDEFVGVVHAVLHALAPAVPVIDLGHQVPPFDVGAGAAMLGRCAPYLGAGVVLAVVDPGVGTARRGIAVETGGEGPSWLVGPDNGLLVPLAGALGGARRAVVLDGVRVPVRPVRRTFPSAGRTGRTFDGRDLFAPAAAHLALGRPADELGVEADPGSLESWESEESEDSADPEDSAGTGRDPVLRAGADGEPGGELETRVTWIDRFGNIQLGIGQGDLDEAGASVAALVRVERHRRAADGGAGAPDRGRPVPVRMVGAFEELDAGELGLLTDSTGRLALVLCRASAARRLGPIETGDTVRISLRTVGPARPNRGGPPGRRP